VSWLLEDGRTPWFRSSSSNNLGQVVLTHVPLSPSSINWYRLNRSVGNSSRPMWERCSLPPKYFCRLHTVFTFFVYKLNVRALNVRVVMLCGGEIGV